MNLQSSDEFDQVERLRAEIDAGIAQFSTGEFTEYDGGSLERFLNDIDAEAKRCGTCDERRADD